jgi:hypothetical protein
MSFLEDRLAATLALINAYEAALLAIVINGAQSYTLDTGQTRQTVTKLDVDSMNKALDILNNRYVTMKARLTGSGTVTVGAAW